MHGETLSEMCELLEISFSGSVEDFSSIFISLWFNTVSFSDLTNTRALQVLSPFVSAFLLGYNLFRSFCFRRFFGLFVWVFFPLGFGLFSCSNHELNFLYKIKV